MAEKRKKKNEDQISDLPDSLIEHILSFLPSTKQSIQTTVLSKRWRNQWTRVPALIFDSDDGMSHQNFLKFIDNTLLLHDCSKIHKFHLQSHFHDPHFAKKIEFAARKHVEDLYLSACTEVILPKILFNNASLVKLKTHYCSFMPNGKVNWDCLSSLEIEECILPYQDLQNIVSGSPSLKLLKLIGCLTEEIVIASKSLKRLLIDFCKVIDISISVVNISCPNLEEVSLKGMHSMYDIDSKMLAQAIENVVSGSLLLESFELIGCRRLDKLVVASKSLKKLLVRDVRLKKSYIEISSPKLEELKLLGHVDFKTAKLLNFSSSVRATIDFYHIPYGGQKTCKSLIMEILQQLQHLKELKIGSWFLEVLSTIKVGGSFSPVLNIKCLTLNSPYVIKHHSGIAHLLHISPVLEKLVINVLENKKVNDKNIGQNYWESNEAVFDCFVSHLKTFKIIGFPDRAGRREHILNLIEFLLGNARVLENMVVILDDNIGTSPVELSQILKSLPRCSQKAVIDVLCSSNSNKEIRKFL